MIHENDRYELPKEVMEMSHEQIKIELEKERKKMVANTNRKPKKELTCGVTFTF